MTIDKRELRAFVRGTYHTQKLRIQTGQRIVSNAKVVAGIPPGTKEKDMKEADKLMKYFRREHKRMADALVIDSHTRLRKMIEEGGSELEELAHEGKKDLFHGIVASPIHFARMDDYETLLKLEEHEFKVIGKLLPNFSIWTEFLEHIPGIGPAMGGVIISEIDIHKARTPSSLWKFSGLDVGPDGKGRSRRKEHLVPREYIDKHGKTKVRDSITYSARLKPKLISVLAGSFLRKKDNKYSRIYDGYKNRLKNMPEHKDKPKGHRHRMALRVMVKAFLKDLYVWWRTAEGLIVSEPYSEAKLRIVHSEKSDAAD